MLDVCAIVQPPLITLDCGNVDFGIVEVGSRVTKTITVINRNPVEGSWSAEPPSSITIEPDHMTLAPLSEEQVGCPKKISLKNFCGLKNSKFFPWTPWEKVTVTWSPDHINDISRETIKVTGTEYGHLKLRGSAIRLHAEFSSTLDHIPDTFVGVQANFTLVLENKDPRGHLAFIDGEKLPSVPETVKFWVSEKADISPLKAYESRAIEIEMISHKRQILEDFIIVAHIKNAAAPPWSRSKVASASSRSKPPTYPTRAHAKSWTLYLTNYTTFKPSKSD